MNPVSRSLASELPVCVAAWVAPWIRVAPMMNVMYDTLGKPGTCVICFPAVASTASMKRGKTTDGTMRTGCRTVRAIERRVSSQT